jgi:hypothetical protein
MTKTDNSPGFIARTELEKAAFSHGYRLDGGEQDGWLRRGSTTARGWLWLAATSDHGPWLLSLERPDVAAELGLAPSAVPQGPGAATFACASLVELYTALDRVYHLGVSLPTVPLEEFNKATAGLPKSTEAEQLIVRRVGQELFRKALMSYWNGRCPLTGITDPALLRASHIVAWVDCESDAQRLDVHNGLLLSALWDAAFDQGLVSFSDDGHPLASPSLSPEARDALCFDDPLRLVGITRAHCVNLHWHRRKHGFVTDAVSSAKG